MANSISIDDADYEVLSQKTVEKMHQEFRAGIETKAMQALPATIADPAPVLDALKAFLLASARKAIPVKKDELYELARDGVEVIEKRTAIAQRQVHAKSAPTIRNISPYFSEAQQAQITRAATQRREDAAVRHLFGDNDRIYLRLKAGAGSASNSPEKQAIGWMLQKHGYTITDYAKGYATDEAGKQQFRIGKLLEKFARETKSKYYQDLLQKFMDDESRISDLLAVISRNPDDIARMSTGRAWNSCMGSGGEEWKHVPEDIREGTLIAYMITERDPDITSPLGRVLIKPLRESFGENMRQDDPALVARRDHMKHVFVIDKEYGINNSCFSGTVEKFVEQHLNAGKTGAFKFIDILYRDETPYRQVREKGKPVRTSYLQ